MRVSVIPAQITSVEDRIIGSLALSQVLLLVIPLFVGGTLYAVLPPFVHAAVYKLVIIVFLFVACGILSIRFKGIILALWIVTILRFNTRPRYYVFNKCSLHNRNLYPGTQKIEKTPLPTTKIASPTMPSLTTAEKFKMNKLLESPTANIMFVIKKGGSIYVRASQVEQKS